MLRLHTSVQILIFKTSLGGKSIFYKMSFLILPPFQINYRCREKFSFKKINVVLWFQWKIY